MTTRDVLYSSMPPGKTWKCNEQDNKPVANHALILLYDVETAFNRSVVEWMECLLLKW